VTVTSGQRAAGDADPGRLPDARHLALAVRRAAAFGIFRPACLVRSIALCRLMESRGIRGASVEVGVALSAGRFMAHAWVRWNGEILGDEEERIAEYRPLSQVGVVHNE
jgi:hypothetical protein